MDRRRRQRLNTQKRLVDMGYTMGMVSTIGIGSTMRMELTIVCSNLIV